ncbi:efflux RND transporter periplasmic adaptor subunit [candidate division KSB1 bacterium]|nr:efflux RND transporter periplasmic adaptor subunit [candidate division KSB1 bacterium]
MKKDSILYGIIAILIVLLVMTYLNPGKSEIDNGSEQEIAFKSVTTPVQIQVIKRTNLVQTINTNGTVITSRQAEIVPRLSGMIQKLNFAEGDLVQKRDTILTIDDAMYRIDYLKAKERVDNALAEYGIMILGENDTDLERGDSAETVFKNIDPENDNDREAFELLKGNNRKNMLASKAGLISARLDLQKARLDLEHTILTAPFDGYLANMELCINGLLKAGEIAFTIVSLDDLLIKTNILETEIQWIQKGAKATITMPALPGKEFFGQVSSINPIMEPESGTCKVMIRVDNPEKMIKPGMFANIKLETRTFEKRLIIPREALVIRDERNVTFVYENGLAKWHYVKTGLENNDYFEVLEGLADGDSLITAGHFNLAHDAKVELVDSKN